jgi:hypothetical protein
MTIDSGNYELHIRYAYHLYKAGIHEESYKYNIEVAKFAYRIGDLDLSERCYQIAINEANILNRINNKCNVLLQLARNVYISWRRYEEATKSLDNIISIDQNHCDARYERARLNIRKGYRGKAIIDLKRVIKDGGKYYRKKAIEEQDIRTLVKDIMPVVTPSILENTGYFSTMLTNDIFESFKDKEVTPLIGPGGYIYKHISEEWMRDNAFPFKKSESFARVAQFMAIESGDNNLPKWELSEYLQKEEVPIFSLIDNKDSPYAILAKLDLPIYITTNYDHTMEKALLDMGKETISELCLWNEQLKGYYKFNGYSSVFDSGNNYIPSPSKPLVYHLYGDMDIPQSMVLTELDHMDFRENIIKDEKLLPAVIRKALCSTLLLFVGYGLREFNVSIYSSIRNNIKSHFQYPHIVTLLHSSWGETESDKRFNQRKFISKHMKALYNISYIMNFNDLIKELRNNEILKNHDRIL